MKSKHQKHAMLAKPIAGDFTRNEWAIIGAPCGEIRTLVGTIAGMSSASVAYVDETHDKEAVAGKLTTLLKMGESLEVQSSGEWNKYLNYQRLRGYDVVLVNGNHFTAEKQIVVLDERKRESLSRKVDRLTNVCLVLVTDEVKDDYEFLGELTRNAPRMHISDTKAIYDFLLTNMDSVPLKGLVLAGGKSERMGEDKGGISYHGIGQAEYMYEMLEKQGIEAHISCREVQREKYTGLRVVEDKFIGLGPFGAIVSAFMSDPNSAWLVLPCDLPLMDSRHVLTLTSKRNKMKQATAFLNRETGFPEPLISIWEPKMYHTMMGFLTQGYSCPRKVLINTDVELLSIQDQQFMMNVNTQVEKQEARQIIGAK